MTKLRGELKKTLFFSCVWNAIDLKYACANRGTHLNAVAHHRANRVIQMAEALELVHSSIKMGADRGLLPVIAHLITKVVRDVRERRIRVRRSIHIVRRANQQNRRIAGM